MDQQTQEARFEHETDDSPEMEESVSHAIQVGQEVSEEDEAALLKAWLDADAEDLETQRVRIDSWSRRLGRDFHITVRELDSKELGDIFSMFEQPQGKGRKARAQDVVTNRRSSDVMAYIVAAAIVEPNIGEIRGGLTPVQFVQRKFKPLEITGIADIVLELSGGGEDAVTVAKN